MLHAILGLRYILRLDPIDRLKELIFPGCSPGQPRVS